ncbi:MAG TPA: AAA family ATPase [Phycisphaerae bacterium]|nr:AAA family ATPase [Phycisphaerae bacterium]
MLQSAKITLFASCVDVVVDLDRHLTCLVGKNGAGKSNILKAIFWAARCGSAAELPQGRQFGQAMDTQISFRLGNDHYRYHVEFDPFATNGFQLNESLHRADTGEILFQRTNDRLQAHLVGPGTINVSRLIPSIYVIMSMFSPESVGVAKLRPVRDFLAGVGYYPMEERSEAPKPFVEEAEYLSWKQRYQVGESISDSVAFRILYLKTEKSEVYNELTSLLGENGLNLINSIVIQEVDVPVTSAPVSDPGSKTKKLYFFQFFPSDQMGGSGNGFDYNRLSSGTKRVIRMLVSLLFDQRSVMLVEQPEDSIHSGLLQKVVDIFRSYSFRTQVIFATHSPAVLNMLTPTETVFVHAKDGVTSVHALSEPETAIAKRFLAEEGSLSDFIEAIEQ